MTSPTVGPTTSPADEHGVTVDDLHVDFRVPAGTVNAVRGISYSISPGERVALVGESGSGKTASALAFLGLLPPSASVRGSVEMAHRDLLSLDDDQLREVRGAMIGIVYQDPYTSLNPVLRVRTQIVEAILAHRSIGTKAAEAEAIELLGHVGIPDAARRIGDYPHQFSGGMRQRVMLAIGVACRPRLLIADEPTTALDVTIQAQILELLMRLSDEYRSSLLLITHDLGVVARITERVNVMYAGRIVESGTTRQIFEEPRHPYTIGLLGSLPRMDRGRAPLRSIAGQPPDMTRPIAGCAFAERCANRQARCLEDDPVLVEVGGRGLACWNPGPPPT
jgi:oligopeptide/dipeptide ABC transporter ATP-binding protein